MDPDRLHEELELHNQGQRQACFRILSTNAERIIMRIINEIKSSGMKKIISTTAAPGAIGPYSQAVEVNGTLYISGQVAN